MCAVAIMHKILLVSSGHSALMQRGDHCQQSMFACLCVLCINAPCETCDANVSQKEQLVPFYMTRALGGYPGCTPINGLSAGVDSAMRELPCGSPVVLYMFHCLAKHTYSLMQKHGTDKQAETSAGLDLLRLLTQMLLVVEFQFLPDALDAVEEVVLGCDNAVGTQASACTCIYEVLSTSDDYTRKVRCAHWYQELASRCGPVGRQTPLRGAEELTHLLLSKSPLP